MLLLKPVGTEMAQASTPNRDVRAARPGPRPLVFVVDDDISIRESLELLVRSAGWLVETYESPQDFLARPRYAGPSCLVLDMSLPGLSGLEVQQRVAGERTDMPIIFITGGADIPATVQAMKAGAVEFLPKPYGERQLLDAVRAALDKSEAALAAQESARAMTAAYGSLTPRERQVLGMVVAGLLNKQVGGELGISEITVKTHRGNMMRKMNADSLADLVKMARELGIPVGKR
jgi:FixJ family two-component response regulator